MFEHILHFDRWGKALFYLHFKLFILLDFFFLVIVFHMNFCSLSSVISCLGFFFLILYLFL